MKSTTSATTTLAPLRPPTVLVSTAFSPSLKPQLKPSANLKTIVSPTLGPQGLSPLIVPAITTQEPQGQAKLINLASPAHETILSGAPSQANVPLPAATTQKYLAVPTLNISTPAYGSNIATGHLLPNNMQLFGCIAEFLMESKKI